MSQNEETRELYESRQKWIHDYVSNLRGTAKEAREAGKREGKRECMKEGMKEGKIEIAKTLLNNGMSMEQIIKLTNLEEELINFLKNEIKH